MGEPVTIDQAVADLIRCGVVAVVRLDSAANVVGAARALARGGVTAIEVTMTTPGALDIIAEANRELGGAVHIGAGTVLRADDARRALDAGASFLVAPTVDEAVIGAAHDAGVPVIAGALTPNEIDRAMCLGADLVKLFPGRVATPGYFADILGPFPDARLLPTGNVDLETAPAYIAAGAVAVGVGKALVDGGVVARGDWDLLTARARMFADAVAGARQARR